MKQSNRPLKNGIVAALDIGSTKICCFIAQHEDNKDPRVIGIGQQASKGVKSGHIVDIETLEDAITNSIHSAEQMAGITIDQVIVNVSGGQPRSHDLSLDINVAGAAVTDQDLRQAIHQVSQIKGPDESGRDILHSIFTGYTLDGNHGIRDPRGMHGEKLSVRMHLITSDLNTRRNLVSCINRCHLELSDFVLSSYASGLATLVDDEMDLGVTLIDMGGTTTSIAVFYDGHLVHSDVIPVGGQHVTNDIARILSTPVVEAERLKTLYGHAISTEDQSVIDVPQVGENDDQHTHQVAHYQLVSIIRCRIEETLELVRDRLNDSGPERTKGHRVVLTGGASQLPGLSDLASRILNPHVRIGKPIRVTGLADATGGPNFATCAGLLTYATQVSRHARPDKIPDFLPPQSLFGRIGYWFRENF